MLSQETIQKLLGIEEKVYLTPETMADKLNVTFFPHRYGVSPEVEHFAKKLQDVFRELKVNVAPYDQSIENVPVRKIIRRFFRVLLSNALSVLEVVFFLPRNHQYIELKAVKSS